MSVEACPMPNTTSPANAFNPAPGTKTENKPKPCCVCKEEKAARDECMLFSKSANPEADCKPMIEKYKTCMAGFGFSLP